MLPDFSKHRFTHKGFHGVLHTFFPVAQAPLQPLRNQYGDCFSHTLFFVHDDYVEWYWDSDEMDRIGRGVIEKASKNRGFLPRLLRQWHELIREFESQIRLVQKTDLSALTDEQLLSLYAQFYDAYVEEFGLALGLQDPFSMHADVLVEPALRDFLQSKGLESRFNEIYAVLFAPIKASFLAREHEDLLKITVLIHKRHATDELQKEPAALQRHPTIANRLHQHAKHYFWISNNYAKTPVLNAGDFLQRALQEKEPESQLRRHQDELRKNRHYKAAIARKLKLPARLRTLVAIGEAFSYMQDERKKYVLISNHYQQKFLKEASRRSGMPLADLQYVAFPELQQVLDGSFDGATAKKRRSFSLCHQTPAAWKIVEGKEAEKIFRKHFKKDAETQTILVGTCANPGHATGPVKIIKKTHDLINMKQGDVLVASMTRPEMLLAMKKAAAIVTDEGGITSHAAVVSRELGIPCLIGTKNASKWLKDGDQVEVDATKGHIKKI